MKNIVIAGARSNVGKTTLAEEIRQLLPGSVRVKLGHGELKEDMDDVFYHAGTPYERIKEENPRADFLIIESNRILGEIDRGVTILHGKGGYTMKDKEVLFCVVTRRSIYRVRQIVIEEDPDAFMVIADLHEVYGFGFKPQKEEETPL